MRYVATALIAFIALGACTEPEPGRQILAPTAATNCRDATLLAVDTTIDYSPLPGAFPARLTRSLPALPKGALIGNITRRVAASFVIDTSGYVIGSTVQMETAPWPPGDQAVCDWLRHTQFEPVRRGGHPVRAAVHNYWGVFAGTSAKPE
jgi:hypothetical protein